LTVAKKYGNRVAVLTGDYMYTRALEVAVGEKRLDLFPILVAATRDMVKGELYQIEYSNIKKINKEHYFRIIEMKTARFMAACAKIGGVKSNMSDEESDVLYEFGLNLGFAFQMVDDVLDFLEAEEITGKDAGNDFMQGKITLPMLCLIERAEGKEKKKIEKLLENPSRDGFHVIRKKILECGAIEYCLHEAETFVRRSLQYLDAFRATQCKDILVSLAEFLLMRNF
ncbi:MAG: polyprenyl synthetase family protein, partial [Spirochaetes bacterium]|nr:polyprenyl synthetase family protein [Spirochaetota bacterium]